MNTPNVQTHQYPDLFPATLLVSLRDGRAETDSLNVAEHFHRRHDNVLRDIEKVIADAVELGGSLLKFEERIYYYLTGKNQTRSARKYVMDRKAFSILVGRFQGKYALRWQIDYHDAFESMERALAQMTQRYAHALDIVQPNIRPVVEGTLAGLSRAAIAQGLGKSCSSVTYHHGRARQFGLLAPKGSHP